MLTSLAASVAGALLLAALSTLYDFIWAYFHVQHRAVYGLVHGMTLLSAAGIVLGWRVRRIAAGAAGGAAAGLLAAASFYAIVGVLGFTGALVGAWMLLWLLFSALEAWLAGDSPVGRTALLRGVLAALASGLAFWLVSGMWTHHDGAGPDYASNFARWTFAFFPGFFSLLYPRAEVRRTER